MLGIVRQELLSGIAQAKQFQQLHHILESFPDLLANSDDHIQAAEFFNVCRRRGARLVGEDKGCKHSFTCPYHAWTWSNAGALRGVPHEKTGFPDLDRSAHGLVRLPLREAHGFLWVIADPKASVDDIPEAPMGNLAGDFDWFGAADLGVAQRDVFPCAANWKLLIEGGIEAYHFKVAHRDTIGPHFEDNLSSYDMHGRHMRSVLPRSSLAEMAQAPKAEWDIRAHANVLYTVFPNTQFLVMQDHVGWMSFNPTAAGLTQITMTTLAPKAELTEEMAAHWARNHGITRVTLAEDFDIGVAVQSGLNSGANTALTFGRFEGALDRFNATVEAELP